MKFTKHKIYMENLFNLIIFLPILSFFLGFYLNENSAHHWIKENIKIFLDNNLKNAVLHLI